MRKNPSQTKEIKIETRNRSIKVMIEKPIEYKKYNDVDGYAL